MRCNVSRLSAGIRKRLMSSRPDDCRPAEQLVVEKSAPVRSNGWKSYRQRRCGEGPTSAAPSILVNASLNRCYNMPRGKALTSRVFLGGRK